MALLMALARRPDPVSLSFVAVTFITGMAVALQVPTLSLFLAKEVQVRPFLVGLFYTVNAVVGILISQWLGHRSDRKGDRKQLILRCCLAGVALSLLFAWHRNYWLLVSVGVLLASLASTASPQLFALAREYADRHNKRADMFSSVLRAQFSLAWVIGPPLAFALAIGYGFDVMYLASACAYLLCAVVVWRWLPSIPRPAQDPDQERVSSWRDPAVRALFIASTLMWTCNSMYLINMPLYITRELGLEERLAGLLMGTAAAIEIPFMLLAGYYTARVGKRPMLLVAVGAGLAFYVGLVTLSSQTALLALQLLNAIFVGIVAGIGMSYFQDLMPGRTGVATTLFTNSIRTGSIMAGAIAGGVAEVWNFHGVFIVATGLALAALVACWRVPNV
ncbi:MFS transporter [Aeromonas cavernicola]|uniref:MFS transporter n=1 Tax=Aeromonas cavernicola TaxID=1006623 RepID=A0A2H9U319_9GAMM|nr:MFS transporter [Aeromonas cavernicola]PJG58456.1 MFS transporter [Aeromonas cavernicola]